jgi:hypothetical protein
LGFISDLGGIMLTELNRDTIFLFPATASNLFSQEISKN